MLKDLKFTEAELGDKDVSSLPDRPSDAGITAAELKARFDMIPKTLLALGKFNQIIDELGATEEGNSGADNIGVSPVVGTSGGTLQAVLGEMGDLTQAAKQAGEIAAAQGAAAVTAADNATAAANAATEKAASAESASEIATSQGKEAAAAATAATAAIIEVKDYAAEQAQSAKDYVDQVILEGGVVSSVFGRAGIIAAEAGDYTAEQITYGETNAAEGITAAAEAAAQAKAITDTKGQANGLATLDDTGKLVQMPTLADIGAKSNANLLDNWYFADPVNQRGQTEYTGAGYGIDRWKKNVGFVTTTLTEDGVKLTNANAIGPGAFGHWQIIDNWQALIGKTVTFSVLVKSRTGGNVHAFVGGVNSGGRAYTDKFGSDYGLYSSTIQVNSEMDNLNCIIRFVDSDNAEVSVIAAKLELGDKQTLAHQDANGNWILNDPPPNKALELAKCQRYYQLFTSADKRPSDKRDFRPELRTNATSANTGTIVIDGVTYYYADANL